MTRPPYIDARSRLPFDGTSPYIHHRPLSSIHYSAVHYTADRLPASASEAQEIQRLIDDANYHIHKDWNPPNGVYGWCLMYHYAAFQSGRIYICNDEALITWAVSNGNPVTLSTVLVLAPGEKPSKAMLATLRRHEDYLCDERPDLPGVHQASVFGHGEMGKIYGGGPEFGNNTPCPDQALSFVRNYRKAVIPMPTPDCVLFTETGQYVCHGFLDYFQAGGGVAHFGFPLTGEMQEKLEDGRTYTVQYFERARFEWHSEFTPARVLEGRLGAEVLGLRHHSGPGIPPPGDSH
jgi:hypothetical protein